MNAVDKNLAIVVVAKCPISGNVKTRLCPPLSHNEAAELYACFLQDTINKVDIVSGVLKYIALDIDESQRSLNPLPDNVSIPSSFSIIDQGSGDLGDRLSHLSGFLLDNLDGLIIVGADSPTLPLSYIEEAIAELKNHDVVIGPSEDGGYYLLGLKRNIGSLFKGVDWSTPFVFNQTIMRARKVGAKIKVITTWYDIDTGDDLLRLAGDIKSNPDLAPVTASFIKRLNL